MIVNLRTAALLAVIGLSPCALAGPSFVGNGDGGADLEGSTPLTSGPIADARGKAADLLRRLNVPGVAGLGLLLPEVESSPLFLAQGDREPSQRDDQGAFHSDMRGLVFARTFAHPHAATRFFPVALGLSESQLVALHIHEGLHRALPSAIAEDEAKVTALTLAITSPNATFDQVQAVASRELPSIGPSLASAAGPSLASAAPTAGGATDPLTATPAATPSVGESVSSGSTRTPIELSYSYIALRDYVSYPGQLDAVSSLQKFEVRASPFHDRLPLTIGAAAVLAATSQDGSFGPIQLSATLKILDSSTSGMELQVWGRSTLTFLAGSAYLQSGVGRSVMSGGFTGRWNTGRFEIEDSLYSTSGGSADFGTAPTGDQISQSGYGTTNFGSSFHDKLSLTRVYDHLRLGAFAQASLGSAYSYYHDLPSEGYGNTYYNEPSDTSGGGQFVFSLGPQISWVERAFAVSLDGNFICPGTHGSFDTFGDVLDQGTGNTVVTAKLALFF